MHASLHARYKCKAGVGGVCALTGWRAYFLFWLLAVLGLYLVGVGAVDDPFLSYNNYQRKSHLAMFVPILSPNSNREVRHSPTWYSSESESALERFEPVAAAKL